jgi:hypothetical protein
VLYFSSFLNQQSNNYVGLVTLMFILINVIGTGPVSELVEPKNRNWTGNSKKTETKAG